MGGNAVVGGLPGPGGSFLQPDRGPGGRPGICALRRRPLGGRGWRCLVEVKRWRGSSHWTVALPAHLSVCLSWEVGRARTRLQVSGFVQLLSPTPWEVLVPSETRPLWSHSPVMGLPSLCLTRLSFLSVAFPTTSTLSGLSASEMCCLGVRMRHDLI